MKNLFSAALLLSAFTMGHWIGAKGARESQHIAQDAIDTSYRWKNVSDKNAKLLHRCLEVPRVVGKSRYRPQHVERKNGLVTITPDSEGVVTIQ